jgi:hypothetical protein
LDVTGELKRATPPPSRVPDVGKAVKGEKSEMDVTNELQPGDPKSKEDVTGELKRATPPPSRVPDVGKDVKGEKSEMDVTGELKWATPSPRWT